MACKDNGTTTESLRQRFKTAWQSTMQGGNMFPMIQFYNENENELNRHDIYLYDLLGDGYAVGSKLASIEKIKTASTPTEMERSGTKETPIQGLVIGRGDRTGRGLPIIAIIAFLAGATLILKSLKK